MRIDDLMEAMCNLASPYSRSDDTSDDLVIGFDKNESSPIPSLSSVFHASTDLRFCKLGAKGSN